MESYLIECLLWTTMITTNVKCESSVVIPMKYNFILSNLKIIYPKKKVLSHYLFHCQNVYKNAQKVSLEDCEKWKRRLSSDNEKIVAEQNHIYKVWLQRYYSLGLINEESFLDLNNEADKLFGLTIWIINSNDNIYAETARRAFLGEVIESMSEEFKNSNYLIPVVPYWRVPERKEKR